MTKGAIQQEEITLRNIHTPNVEAPKYIKQILTDIKGEIYIHERAREKLNPRESVLDLGSWRMLLGVGEPSTGSGII